VTAVGGPRASELIRAQVEAQLVGPLMDAFGLAAAGRAQVEAYAKFRIRSETFLQAKRDRQVRQA
jgi:hypothetical protein